MSTSMGELQGPRLFVDRLLAEPVPNTMRFKKCVLTASGRHLPRYFKYVSDFPRATSAD